MRYALAMLFGLAFLPMERSALSQDDWTVFVPFGDFSHDMSFRPGPFLSARSRFIYGDSAEKKNRIDLRAFSDLNGRSYIGFPNDEKAFFKQAGRPKFFTIKKDSTLQFKAIQGGVRVISRCRKDVQSSN